MSRDHGQQSDSERKLKLGFALNTGYMLFEFAVGLASGSLALLSDAAHNLTDSVTLAISFFANRIGQRKADGKRTYGYGRATILAALLNSTILFAIAGYVFLEAYRRFLNPVPVGGALVALVAGIGVVVNASVALMLRDSRQDLNMRSALLNMAFDAAASLGALLAGLLIILTGWSWIDPVIGVMIGFMLLYGAQSVLRSALHVLLEGVPEGVDIESVRQAIVSVEGVTSVDDLHIWAISSKQAALSGHLVVASAEAATSFLVVRNVKQLLRDRFQIDHATLEPQLEVDSHDHERAEQSTWSC